MASSDTSFEHFPRILHLEEVGSTNAEALRLASLGERGPVWIRAGRQTEGRGRSGRPWTSEPGNLFATLLLGLDVPQPKAYQLSLVAGVAVIEAVRKVVAFRAAPDLRLKWPNDILIGGAKTGGILVESSAFPDRAAGPPGGLVAAIGIGINIVSHPRLERPVTHLGLHGTAPTAPLLLEQIAFCMNRWMLVWDNGAGFPLVREAWLGNAHPLGERMSINAGRGVIEGEFAGIDEEGALMLRVAGKGETRFTFGDVTVPGRAFRPQRFEEGK